MAPMAPRQAPLKPKQRLNKPDKLNEYFGPMNPQTYSAEQGSRPSTSSGIRTIAWNPLGTLVATGSMDRTLRVWNPEKPIARFSTELKGHLESIEKIAFNPVKDAELCSVDKDGVIKFWDVRTKGCVNEVKGLTGAFTLAWAPNGESLIVGTQSDNIAILSPTESTPRATYQQSLQTNQIAFCWSGKKIFMATGDGRIRILSYPDLEPVLEVESETPGGEPSEFKLTGHTTSCLSVELSPTGRYLASGGSDSMIALWDTTDWICQRTIGKMSGPVRSISFSFDGTYVVGGSEDGSGVEATHVESGEHVHTIKTAGPVPIVSWAPTRLCLAYSDLGLLRIIGVDGDRK